jgi:hypothetical protein
MPHLKTIGLPVALAAALSAAPRAAASDVEKPVSRQDVNELKSAQEKSFKELMEEIRSLREQLNKVDGLRKDVDGLKSTVQSLNTALELSTQMLRGTTGDVADVRAQLKQAREELDRAKAQAGKMEDEVRRQAARCDGLTEELAQLRKKTADGARESARMTEGTGTVRLYNTYALPVSVVISGRSYRLDPGETYVLGSQPVGPFSYEVLGLGYEYRRNGTLTADRPFEIEVFDQARGPLKTPPRPPR